MLLFLFFISSGLFLGWSLGGNDTANIFGSAVGSKMLSFRQAAFIASIFVILGAVFQGKGAAITLNQLGQVDALAGGFTVALSAALVIFLMTRRSLPISTSQAVVGAIIGWTFFVGLTPDLKVLGKIVSTWIFGPLLGMLFSAGLYVLVRRILRRVKIHVLQLDEMIRLGLIVAGAFGAYSLGANNIANVMGVFINSAPRISLDFGIFTLDGVQLLFLIGGLAIATGVFTYSHKVMHTVGSGLLDLTPIAAFVVVLSHGLVLFLFSSVNFSNFLKSIGLPALPLVPVSSTQVIIGSVIGIGLVKGVQEIKYRLLLGIAAGWIVTPIASGLVTFLLLFFVQNVFQLPITSSTVHGQTTPHAPLMELAPVERVISMILPGLIILAVLLIIVLTFLLFRQQQKRLKAENELLMQQNQLFAAQKVISDFEISAMQREKTFLQTRLEQKKKEFDTAALNLSNQYEFLNSILEQVEQARELESPEEVREKLRNIATAIRQKMAFNAEKEILYRHIEELEKEFLDSLQERYPNLTEHEKRLILLIRTNLSNKEIAAMMNIAPKSVEMAKYRLKKTLGLSPEDNLTQFIQQL